MDFYEFMSFCTNSVDKNVNKLRKLWITQRKLKFTLFLSKKHCNFILDLIWGCLRFQIKICKQILVFKRGHNRRVTDAGKILMS